MDRLEFQRHNYKHYQKRWKPPPDAEIRIVKGIRGIGLEPISYRGRGMMGRQCVGVVCNEPLSTALMIGMEIGPYIGIAIEVDMIGKQYILYFPDIVATLLSANVFV